MVSVFRLARWKTYHLQVSLGGSLWTSLEEAYLVPVVLAHTMMGRRAFYIGHPCVLSIQGGQEWLNHWPVFVAIRIQELLDLYLQLGIDRRRVERCRRASLKYSAWAVQRFLSDPTTPGRHYFSLRKFLWRNRNHPVKILAIFLSVWISGKSPHPVRAAFKRILQATTKRGVGSQLKHFLES
jgi:hypothetical protein